MQVRHGSRDANLTMEFQAPAGMERFTVNAGASRPITFWEDERGTVHWSDDEKYCQAWVMAVKEVLLDAQASQYPPRTAQQMETLIRSVDRHPDIELRIQVEEHAL